MYFAHLLIYVVHFGSSCITLNSFPRHSHPHSSPPVINLPYGQIQGHYLSSRGGRMFSSYEGIPYASAPVGPLRWQQAAPPQPWDGIKDCTREPPICPQVTYMDGLYAGQEDCLYLNVFKPQEEKGREALPVMVWIHGGSLFMESGTRRTYGPSYLMDEDIIMVSFNYRLGVFGFLSLDTPEISGNQGFKDQVAALTWVQQNIHLFGGDPTKVTIFGESAGSWSVVHHVLSPLSTHLFRAAIGESGTILGGLRTMYFSREQAFVETLALAQNANCSSNDSQIILQCLREKPTKELFDVANQHKFNTRGNIDDFSAQGSFLPGAPESLLEFGLFNQVPIILGTNSGEGSSWMPDVMQNPNLLDEYDQLWDFYGPVLMFGRDTDNNGSDFAPHDVDCAEAAKQFYFNGTVSHDKVGALVDARTDTFFLKGVDDLVIYLGKFTPVYQYIFTFRDHTSFTFTPGLNMEYGVAHGDELGFILDMPIYFPNKNCTSWSEDNWRISKLMLEMWTNFAYNLNPTPDEHLGFIWNPVEQDYHQYLKVGENPHMEMEDDYRKRMAFWEKTIIN